MKDVFESIFNMVDALLENVIINIVGIAILILIPIEIYLTKERIEKIIYWIREKIHKGGDAERRKPTNTSQKNKKE